MSSRTPKHFHPTQSPTTTRKTRFRRSKITGQLLPVLVAHSVRSAMPLRSIAASYDTYIKLASIGKALVCHKIQAQVARARKILDFRDGRTYQRSVCGYLRTSCIPIYQTDMFEYAA